MRSLIFCAALLLAAPALAQERQEGFNWENIPTPQVALVCDTEDRLRSIIRAAIKGGPLASTERYNRINESALLGKQACTVTSLDPTLKMQVLGGYAAVPAVGGEVRDVLLLEVEGKDGTAFYAAIDRPTARDSTL